MNRFVIFLSTKVVSKQPLKSSGIRRYSVKQGNRKMTITSMPKGSRNLESLNSLVSNIA